MKIRKLLRIFEVRYTGASNAPIALHFGTNEKSSINLSSELATDLAVTPQSVCQNLVLELETIEHDWFTETEVRSDLLSINDLQKIEKVLFFNTINGEDSRVDSEYTVTITTPTFGTLCILPVPYINMEISLTEQEYQQLLNSLTSKTKFRYKLIKIEPPEKAN
jgi:hypothetical protein